MTQSNAPTRRHGIPVAATLLAAAVALSGCTTGAPPEETAEQLTEVAEDPTPPEAAEDLDVTNEPEPVVDELECSPYLAITARGTGEPHKRQLLSPVVRQIGEVYPDEVQSIDLDYPASGDIKEGATIGIRMLIDTLNQQAEVCPTQRFFLLGYSQGALVVGESLVAPESRLLGATVGEVSQTASDNIAAVVLYADPRFVGSDPFAAGTFNPLTNGLLERQAGTFDAYEDRTVSFCVAEDFICQASPNFTLDEQGHVAYYSNGMQSSGASFVLAQMRLGAIDDLESDKVTDTPADAEISEG